eukprot:CAMPEP_0172197410 /NCGR_PEP_ID=MMETSP1050-20130122/27446_1 /TAXON_ID=233186 /ORGANISM="Cryptomonas curvata, Strain CCAP979/52" /LENGTH=59 /DNA_ID=CAMNT_0012873977 /DNA_START=91 /DNA_END=267 /DNA_ORIENTATION=+
MTLCGAGFHTPCVRRRLARDDAGQGKRHTGQRRGGGAEEAASTCRDGGLALKTWPMLLT